MNIENSLIKMYDGHHHSKPVNALSLEAASQQPIPRRHEEEEDDDALKLSDSARASKTIKTEVDRERKLEAEHQLSVQIMSQMFKKVTGQDLQLTLPADLTDQLGPVSAQTPQQAPTAQGSDPVNSPTYQQSQSYFEAQMVSFNAQGSISTNDGQSLSFVSP